MIKYPFINIVCREFIMDYWPDDPPWTSLFGIIGRVLCENWGRLTVEEKIQLFEMIEPSMDESTDEFLQTVVATGLVESIIHLTDKNQILWSEIESYMLPMTKEFANTYKNWMCPDDMDSPHPSTRKPQ